MVHISHLIRYTRACFGYEKMYSDNMHVTNLMYGTVYDIYQFVEERDASCTCILSHCIIYIIHVN
jgi:hypothetical protein